MVYRSYDIVKRGVSLENTLDIILRSFLMAHPLFHLRHRGTAGLSLRCCDNEARTVRVYKSNPP